MSHRFGSVGCGLPVPLILLCLATSCHVCSLCKSWTKLHTNADPPQHHLFVFQSHPVSLQLLIHAEGEKLILLLEKNEWVFLWFTETEETWYLLCKSQPIDKPMLPATAGWSLIYIQKEGRLYGSRLWYSVFKEGKIICPLVIGLFYGSVSLKGREMKADKE